MNTSFPFRPVKKPHPVTPPPPASLDLGNLSALQPGAEVVSVTLDGGKLEVGRVRFVHSIKEGDAYPVKVRNPERAHFSDAYKVTGEGVRTIFCGDRWLSANPEHIARSKAEAEAARIAEEAKQAAFNKLLEQAKPIGEVLGDGWQDDNDGGSHYSTAIAHELAERLTSEQLATLAGWLGVKS